ncbi:HAMP domain-containing sensor histidine kinase [Anaeromicropila populeti]|uniref:histidine kinase n=1 Tax=Anaeromicropila populeti TaxID=37658 RepID=A0A1I6KC98_9FIRM|nr:HAMP domain-containing sensor histidine kinase [Anaeromicropila populeti]SFR88774.1 Signal transduction histidine kinase [Anaeromicropila populeti]
MNQKDKIRQSHLPVRYFGITFLVMLLVAGVHAGLILLLTMLELWSGVTAAIIIIYWIMMAALFVLITNKQMVKYYETPMKELAKATNAVAKGDFSVYMPPIHTADKLDYLDVMIMDFNKMVEELGSIETLKTDFFSNVSHEIKTPLAVISNYAQLLLRQDNLTEEEKDYVKNILSASKKLTELITNILKINKLEKQNINPEIVRFDVNEQICNCIFQFEEKLTQKEIELTAELDERLFIEADASLLELVWNNLLSNAVKFTDQGGTIDIKEEISEDTVTIMISDSGCGMSEETMQHVFDKFYQGDTSHAMEGNGLGMALVFRILQMFGGEISVKSELSCGTTFSIVLPKYYDYIKRKKS